MYLKQIQAYGFKSFADKISFDWTNNINGIVGPNGSGKSNVVDAVRWVMGEQSNKQLRADTGVSVIFSGSKSRKPLNSAMVNLIFDNSDRHLPIDYSEVSIKRILYRSGENEYYLNGEKCRLKDINELFIDSGAARESFNIIGQGKIDEILSTKPTDRRVIFEEAAGVLKYKKRKEEALRKLERTNNNINRVEDIIKELETNLEPLKEQSKSAKTYLSVKENLTNNELSLIIYDLDNFNNEWNICKENISKLNDEITELNNNTTSYDVNITLYKNNLNSINDNLNKIRNLILEKTKLLEKTDADIRILRERKKYISSDFDLDKINSLNENKYKLENEYKNYLNILEINKKKIEVYTDEIKEYNNKYINIKNKVDKNNNLINEYNRNLIDYEYHIKSLEENINNGGSIPNSVRNILNNKKLLGVKNTIGALLEVESKYSEALSTSLGMASNYLIVDSVKTASSLVDYLKINRLGRATFYPMDVIKERRVDSDTLNKISTHIGFVNTLDKLVKYDKTYENIMLNQLGNVIVTTDIYNANEISKIINNKYKIVTLDGQVVNVGGSITGGDKVKNNDVIRLKYELDEYRNKELNITNNRAKILNEIELLNKELNEWEEKIVKNRNLINEFNNDINIKNNNIDELLKEINRVNDEIKDLSSITSGNYNDEESKLLSEYYQIKDEIDKLRKEEDLIKISYNKTNKDINELEEFSKNDRIHINKLESSLKENELKSSKIEVRIDNILNSLNENYNMTYSEAKEKYKLEDNPEDVRREVNRLKNILSNLGVVNLGSIEEYERINTRYEFLSKQREDLNKAEDTLLEIINDMDNIMKDRFIKTFDEIRIEFKKVFRELFRGGNADIFLTDPDNILETGIDIEATPPGKSLKNIQSLSGGERTFTAISLLFSILNVRPVPFCILDEVEAALDEANVDAFGEYLDKYRDKTQFILITHKKKTMEFVNNLYGITMQESGVSKLVSVKLDEIK